jgi:hypothetical protein
MDHERTLVFGTISAGRTTFVWNGQPAWEVIKDILAQARIDTSVGESGPDFPLPDFPVLVNPTPEPHYSNPRHFSDDLDALERRLRRLEKLPGVAEALAASDAREIEEKERELRKP